MLSNLDNEVIFKKAFTNLIVFKAFVRDILGIEIEVDKIETEKKFEPQSHLTPEVGTLFEIDIYAESIDKRVCIEIQRLEYDSHFDRFLHYFLSMIVEQQRRAKAYNINQTVYMIVVLTAPYTICKKNGKPILDEVLLLNLNPQTFKGEIRDLYGHQFVCLNPNHSDLGTPQKIRDWLDLIYQSIHNPQRPVLNIENEGIQKAIELISFENLTSKEIVDKKNKESAKIVLSIQNDLGKKAAQLEIAKSLINSTLTNSEISKHTGLDISKIEELRKEI